MEGEANSVGGGRSTEATAAPMARQGSRKKWLLGISALLVVALGLSWGAVSSLRTYRLRDIPNIAEPFDLETFGNIAVKPEENAFTYFNKSKEQLIGADWNQLSEDLQSRKSWSELHPDTRGWLEKNQNALEQYLRGAEQKEAIRIQPRDLKFDSLWKLQELDYYPTQSGCFLAQFEAIRCEGRGDVAGAWNCHLANLRTGIHLARHRPFSERDQKSTFRREAIERAIRWSEHPRVDAALLRTALRDVVALRRTNSEVIISNLHVEYFLFLDRIRELTSADGKSTLNIQKPPSADSTEWTDVDPLPFMAVEEPELSLRLGKLVWKNWLHEFEQPGPHRPRFGLHGLFSLDPSQPRTEGLYSDAELSPWLQRTTMTQWILLSMKHVLAELDKDLAWQELLELVLCLRLYALEHAGAYPASLEELKPHYIAELPADPFGKGEPFHFRREKTPTEISLWSIGPDEVDDSGKLEWTTNSSGKGDLLVRLLTPKPAPVERIPHD